MSMQALNVRLLFMCHALVIPIRAPTMTDARALATEQHFPWHLERSLICRHFQPLLLQTTMRTFTATVRPVELTIPCFGAISSSHSVLYASLTGL